MGDSPIHFNILSDQAVNFNTTQSVRLALVHHSCECHIYEHTPLYCFIDSPGLIIRTKT